MPIGLVLLVLVLVLMLMLMLATNSTCIDKRMQLWNGDTCNIVGRETLL
jgi:hypothetical protein